MLIDLAVGILAGCKAVLNIGARKHVMPFYMHHIKMKNNTCVEPFVYLLSFTERLPT